MAAPWFNPIQFGTWYGTIIGSVTGVVGGTLGALAGNLATRGIGRSWILRSFYFVVALGVLQFSFGLCALVVGQPRNIWFWPFLIGLIVASVMGPLIPVVRQRYRQAEKRRLEAEALRKS
jgi:hypothetical protein